ncbi:uncharacterized protein H6S33_005719 [Morchella sextelata]|uniref:uncharacterized protein n=1 Tax=Morchella sextelata TaxID=1174677 RepID=UPI001D045A28|nr:uncharacterized protein H6S33_005719 [Morchella sextelata]KAH0613833.1 hypothetical protein H6S33_005719 [Morchella sextelata]
MDKSKTPQNMAATSIYLSWAGWSPAKLFEPQSTTNSAFPGTNTFFAFSSCLGSFGHGSFSLIFLLNAVALDPRETCILRPSERRSPFAYTKFFRILVSYLP